MRTPFKILVVEDSEPDFILLKKALDTVNDVEIEITHVINGQDCLDYVFKEERYSDVDTPDIIILDLNLPIKNGFEVLKCIKSDALYRLIPIIIYSTSDEAGDICASYSLYANSYLTKTFDITELFEKIKCFSTYWGKSVELPSDDQYCMINKENK